jgi:hypothetical protein
MKRVWVPLAAVGLCGALWVLPLATAEKAPAKTVKKSAKATSASERRVAKTTPAQERVVRPKPLSASVKNGLAWLVRTQHENGGWSQGEESAQMGRQANGLSDTPNVADTCMATLALIRAGSTPAKGPHAANIRRALDYICGEVERSDEKSLFVTSIRGTRVQGKLGTYIDTFLTSMVLAEVRNQMPDTKSRKRVAAAFHKVMDKIERNQQSDGTWAKDGWAPTLAQSVASKALNRAAQTGAPVDEKVRQRAERYARGNFDAASGGFAAEGSAGVQLYAGASTLAGLQDSDNTNGMLEKQTRDKLRGAKTESERKEAEQMLKRIAGNRKDLQAARAAIVRKLDDQQFVAGFGSNGGEEFISYMNIGESLVVKGGPEWQKWDRSMTQNLNRIQNGDGSWSGHHCITGRTICTAAALMVLTVDRAPVPVASKLARR